MRVGMAVPVLGFQGGIERHAQDLATELVARGHEITLLHGAGRGRDVEAYVAPFHGVRALAEPGAGRGLEVAYVHKANRLAELDALDGVPLAIASHDHDLTCVRRHRYLPVGHQPCHRAPGWGCVASGCVVTRRRGPLLPVAFQNPMSLRKRTLELSRRGRLVTCSAYVKRRLVEAGVQAERVTVVHPVPPPVDTPLKGRPRERCLLVAGQLIRGKGFDLAIEALQWLPDDVTLDVVGDGPWRGHLEGLARQHAPRVRFLGYRAPSEMTALYDAAWVVVVPSRWPEPFGMVGIEAMFRGRPVVAARHGGIPEWLVEPEAGRGFEPGQASSLAAAIDALRDDDDAGERARRFASQRFSHAEMATQIEALLQEVAADA